MEDHLVDLLKSTGLARIVWGRKAHKFRAPYLRISVLSGVPGRHLTGGGWERTQVQIDCFARDIDEARTLRNSVKASLDGYQGGPIQGAFLGVIREGIEDDPTDLERITMTFEVVHQA